VRADFELAGHTVNEINHDLFVSVYIDQVCGTMSGNLLSICKYIRSSRDIICRWLSSRARDYTVAYHSLPGTAHSNPTSWLNKVRLADFQTTLYTLINSTAMSAEASTSKASKKTKQSRDREEDESAGEGEASVEVNKNKRHRKEKRESASRVVATC